MSYIGDFSGCWPSAGSKVNASRNVHGSLGWCGTSPIRYCKLTYNSSATHKYTTWSLVGGSMVEDSGSAIDAAINLTGSNTVNKRSGVITFGVSRTETGSGFSGTPPSVDFGGCCGHEDESGWSWRTTNGWESEHGGASGGGSGSAAEFKAASEIAEMAESGAGTDPFWEGIIIESYANEATCTNTHTYIRRRSVFATLSLVNYGTEESPSRAWEITLLEVKVTTDDITLEEPNPVADIVAYVEGTMLASIMLTAETNNSGTVTLDEKPPTDVPPAGMGMVGAVDNYSDPLPTGDVQIEYGSGGGGARMLSIQSTTVSSSKVAECMAWRSLLPGESCEAPGNVVIGQWTKHVDDSYEVRFTDHEKVFDLAGCWAQNRQPLFILSPNGESPACGFCADLASKISQVGETQCAVIIQHSTVTGGDALASEFSTDPEVSPSPCN